MAESPVITCPECLKKFKGRGDLVGKKIKCPFCTKPFVVAASAPEKPKVKSPAKAPAATAVKAAAAPAVPTPPTPPPKPPVLDEDDEPIGGSYGVGNVDITFRCPNCAQPMLSDDATVCVYCGYNTLTREVGKTEKTFAVTGGEHVLHLAPGLVSAFFIVVIMYLLITYCVFLPGLVGGGKFEFLAHESLRFWLATIGLGIIWRLGNLCFKYLVIQPKPKEKKKEE